MSNGIFNFNFLALVLSEILGGSQIYTRVITSPIGPHMHHGVTRGLGG